MTLTGMTARGSRYYAIHLAANTLVLCFVAIPVCLLAYCYAQFEEFPLAWVWSLRYRDVALMQFLPCENRRLVAAVRQYDGYWLFEHYVMAAQVQRTPCSAAVTYCTHGRDLSFFAHLPALAASWRGPISAALYAPGTDFGDMLGAIQYVRHCLLQSSFVRDWVSFHLVVPHAHMPPEVPHGTQGPEHWPYDCNRSAPYEQWDYRQVYAYRRQLAYPVNVLRNLARQMGNTHYFISADVHLLVSSPGAWDNFLETVYKTVCPSYTQPNGDTVRHCWHMNAKKQVLSKLHMIPDDEADERVSYEIYGFRLRSETAMPATLTEFLFIHEEGKSAVVRSIDPNFIGDPTTPYLDERINWQADNPRHLHMQTYAMCLLNIRMFSLSDLFLAFYEDKEPRIYPNTTAFTAEAAYLNNGKLQNEYANLYGSERKEACRLCFYRRKVCF